MTDALFSALLLMLGSSPELTPNDGASTIAELSQRNAGLKSYTFDLHVAILVHSIPQLRFHLDGTGEYERPSTYIVHFKKVPWFAPKGFENVSLMPLEPSSWPKQYTITTVQHDGDTTTLTMKDKIKSPLSEAKATLDARSGLKQMIWSYNYGGRIQLDVTPSDVSGFPLPSTEDADITMPALKVTAHADFTNYHVTADDAATLP